MNIDEIKFIQDYWRFHNLKGVKTRLLIHDSLACLVYRNFLRLSPPAQAVGHRLLRNSLVQGLSTNAIADSSEILMIESGLLRLVNQGLNHKRSQSSALFIRRLEQCIFHRSESEGDSLFARIIIDRQPEILLKIKSAEHFQLSFLKFLVSEKLGGDEIELRTLKSKHPLTTRTGLNIASLLKSLSSPMLLTLIGKRSYPVSDTDRLFDRICYSFYSEHRAPSSVLTLSDDWILQMPKESKKDSRYFIPHEIVLPLGKRKCYFMKSSVTSKEAVFKTTDEFLAYIGWIARTKSIHPLKRWKLHTAKLMCSLDSVSLEGLKKIHSALLTSEDVSETATNGCGVCRSMLGTPQSKCLFDARVDLSWETKNVEESYESFSGCMDEGRQYTREIVDRLWRLKKREMELTRMTVIDGIKYWWKTERDEDLYKVFFNFLHGNTGICNAAVILTHNYSVSVVHNPTHLVYSYNIDGSVDHIKDYSGFIKHLPHQTEHSTQVISHPSHPGMILGSMLLVNLFKRGFRDTTGYNSWYDYSEVAMESVASFGILLSLGGLSGLSGIPLGILFTLVWSVLVDRDNIPVNLTSASFTSATLQLGVSPMIAVLAGIGGSIAGHEIQAKIDAYRKESFQERKQKLLLELFGEKERISYLLSTRMELNEFVNFIDNR
jgi:hypothetical protein